MHLRAAHHMLHCFYNNTSYTVCTRLIPQFNTMSSMLELVLAERAAQAEEEGRPPFISVETLRSFIIDQAPPPYLNVSLEMCILTVQEQDTFWKVELIDKGSCADFHALASAFEHLDTHRRNRFVFQLTLWKNRNRLLNNVQYREGFTYKFTKVHALTIRYGCPCGSIQLREGFSARRLTDPTESSAQLAAPLLATIVPVSLTTQEQSEQHGDHTQTASETETLGAVMETSDGDANNATPSINPVSVVGPDSGPLQENQHSPKRKTRDVEPHEPAFASPLKRARARPPKTVAS